MDECIKYIDWYALPRKSLNKTTFNSIGLAIEKFKDKTIPFYSAAMMTSEIAIILCPCFKIHTTAGYSSSLLNTYPVHITCPSYGSSTHLSIGVQATIKHSPGNTKYQPTPTHSQILQHEQLSNETTSIAK
jgi:hypothetical protein